MRSYQLLEEVRLDKWKPVSDSIVNLMLDPKNPIVIDTILKGESLELARNFSFHHEEHRFRSFLRNLDGEGMYLIDTTLSRPPLVHVKASYFTAQTDKMRRSDDKEMFLRYDGSFQAIIDEFSERGLIFYGPIDGWGIPASIRHLSKRIKGMLTREETLRQKRVETLAKTLEHHYR